MHGNRSLLTDLLGGRAGLRRLCRLRLARHRPDPGEYYSDVVTVINAGIDMVMVPYDYIAFINALTQAVAAGDVPMARIDDAVRRILRVKLEMGMFEQPLAELARPCQHRLRCPSTAGV